MKPVRATGSIVNGKLTLDNRKELEKALSVCEDCDVELVVDKAFTKRTSQQKIGWIGVDSIALFCYIVLKISPIKCLQHDTGPNQSQ